MAAPLAIYQVFNTLLKTDHEKCIASFPYSTQLSVLQVMESWAESGNEAKKCIMTTGFALLCRETICMFLGGTAVRD